jgi:hypothetical protein
MKKAGFQEIQSFTMDLQGNYSQFPKDRLAQLFQLKSELIQQELDFFQIIHVNVFIKK